MGAVTTSCHAFPFVFINQSDGYDATDEQLDAARLVIENRLVALNVTDYELYVDNNSDSLILEFPWQSGSCRRCSQRRTAPKRFRPWSRPKSARRPFSLPPFLRVVFPPTRTPPTRAHAGIKE